MSSAFLWGLLSASSLLIGGVLTFRVRIGNKLLGLIMAFGAGVLISAVAFEMAHEATELAGGTGMAALGLFTGALAYFVIDSKIARKGGHKRKSIGASHGREMAVPIVLGIVLDGIPESIVIGMSLIGGQTVSLAMLIAVFLSNLPETIAATTGLLSGGWSRVRILGLWLLVVIVCALASLAGFALFGNASGSGIAFIQGIAGGAILVMLADTMIPEAYEHGGKLAGIVTVAGFAVAVYFSLIS
jgi:ZIP family zinc transporter